MREELGLKCKKEKRATYIKKDLQGQNAKIQKKKSKNGDDTDAEDSEDTSYLYCLGASRAMWIQCTECKLRSHE
jgi:hypothetical protein